MVSAPKLIALTNKAPLLVESSTPFTESLLIHDVNIRHVLFSPKGNFVALRSDKKTELVRCSNWLSCGSFQGGQKEMSFSPLDTYFLTWETYVMNKEYPQGKPNLHLYKIETGEKLASFVQKTQIGWEPQWSSDENLFAYQEGGRVLIYQDGNFERYTQQIITEKLQSFSISPSPAPAYYFSTFSPSKSGQPAVWKIFHFPEFVQPIAARSSFQADRATFHWNRRGTNVFGLTHADVDKTGGSYYGKQALSYADVKGNAGNMAFSKEGPIHAIAWNPSNSNEWMAVYGHMPSKATVYTAKCEPLFEFGTGSWNTLHYSPDGTKILLGGFGNVATCKVDVWDMRGYKLVGTFTAPDTTYIQWDPRSECILTATTYPRLTVANGYKLWHYTGAMLHKRACFENEQLLSMAWQPGSFAKSELSRAPPPATPQDTAPAPAQAYRPPGARNRPSNFVLHEHEKPHKPGEVAAAAPSKAAIKNKEKREARKARKAEEKSTTEEDSPKHLPATPKPAFVSTGDVEKDKKIKAINKKLSDIAKLKEMKAAGKPLEINQKAKIESEKSLLDELAKLKL